MSKKIICIIDKDGGMKVKTEGYSGEECLKATEKLEKGLGMNSACELTPEYYANVQNHQQVGGDGNDS
jgi:hypothetical protein